MNNGSSDIHVVRIEYSGEWLELKKTEKKRWRLRLSPLSRPQLFPLFFLCTYTPRAEAQTSSPGSSRFPYWKARRPWGRGCRGPWIDPVSLSYNKYGTKKKLKTVQWKKPRKWSVTTDWYINNFSKSQVYVAHSFRVICRNISRTIVDFVWRRLACVASVSNRVIARK